MTPKQQAIQQISTLLNQNRMDTAYDCAIRDLPRLLTGEGLSYWMNATERAQKTTLTQAVLKVHRNWLHQQWLEGRE